MDEEQPSGPIFIIIQGSCLRCFWESGGVPFQPLKEAIKVRKSDGEVQVVALGNLLNRLRVYLVLLLIAVDPRFPLRSLAHLMLLFRALQPVEFILCSIDGFVTLKFITAWDRCGHSRHRLNGISKNFTVEDTIYSQTSVAAERDRLCKVVGALEVEVFKISRHERVLKRITEVIKGLVDLSLPLMAELFSFTEKHGIELDQADYDVAAHRFELQRHRFPPILRLDRLGVEHLLNRVGMNFKLF